MTWTYSGNPESSELDFYRFSIGDTIQSDGILQDEEINFVLEKYQSHNERMYHLYDAMSSLFARRIRKSLGPQYEDPRTTIEYFKAKREEYRRLITAGSGFSIPVSKKSFWKGMHDNV